MNSRGEEGGGGGERWEKRNRFHSDSPHFVFLLCHFEKKIYLIFVLHPRFSGSGDQLRIDNCELPLIPVGFVPQLA